MIKFIRNYKAAIILMAFIIFWAVLLYFFKPKEIIESIGIGNSYLMAFILAVAGAFSSFTTVSIYPAIVTLAAGGLHPLILGIVAGIGLSLGDTVFYFFGEKARGLASEKFKKKLDKFLEWLNERPQWMVPVGIYLYVGFTPFPNNVLTGSLALADYPFKKVVVPLVLGDMTLPILAAYLVASGMEIK